MNINRSIKSKFLVPILGLQFVALLSLGVIGYNFSSGILRNAAQHRFEQKTELAYATIEEAMDERIAKVKTLLSSSVFTKFSAAPFYKSSVDTEVFNFQKGNGLILKEPALGDSVNFPVGLLPNSGNRKVAYEGLFPSEEYVSTNGIVKQHVYLGGSNDANFENNTSKNLNRSGEDWFKAAMSGKTYAGKPRLMPIYLKKYDPVSITRKEICKHEKLIPIAIPHIIGGKIVGILMVSTGSAFLNKAIFGEGKGYLLALEDSDGKIIAKSGDSKLAAEINKIHSSNHKNSYTHHKKGEILEEGPFLAMHKNIKATGWSISMYGKKSSIYNSVHKFRNNTIFIIALSIAAMGIIIFFIIKRLTMPILKLTSASERIASGELGFTIDKKSDDEIGTLTDSFNKMSTATKTMTDKLNRINFVRRQLLNIISHELRTPLNTIVGFYDILKEDIEKNSSSIKANDDTITIFMELGNGIERLKKLVERLTKTTSSMAGEMQAGIEVDIEAAELKYEISKAVEAARATTKRDIKIATTGKIEDIKVSSPPNAIKLIVDEAISNAVKYSPKEKPIWIKLGTENEFAVISIHDEGSGIPKEYIDDVIEPFFEVQDSMLHSTGRYVTKGGGLGLGLTIIGSILRRYQGTMRIDSTEGKGTTLEIKLPLIKE